MASVTVSRVVRAPQREVWALLSDIQNAGRWNKAWSRIELTSNQRHGLGATFRTVHEGGETYDFEVCEWAAPDRIGFCPIRREGEPTYSIMLDAHVFDLSAVSDDETMVELSAHATPHGLRGRFIALFLWPGHQKEGLNSALESIAAVFEGEPPAAELETGPESFTD